MRNAEGERCGYGLLMSLILSVELGAGGGVALGQTAGGSESGQQPRISVRVYNYAQVSNEILRQAEGEAAGIYCAAGVEITWTNCNAAKTDLAEDSPCDRLLDPAHLGVRVIPDLRAAPGTSDGTMGFALGNLANVSVRGVGREADEFGVKLDAVLGPVLAHEIGHLLLVSEGHSSSGIMRARWRREDYERAPRGALAFTPKQAQSIRSEVRERVQEQAAGQVATAKASK